ncbi:MAG: hypothetical protein HKN50_00920 [Gammaproteobacteria bacterium]|nr:hypothetical protein [Gammaproteobacteria bacterium]
MPNVVARIFILLLALAVSPVQSASLDFDLLAATPVGSWQEREETTVNQKGKKTVTIMRSSLLGKEQRNDKPYYWIEMAMESFKVSKKGKRKKTGDRVVIKTLVSEASLTGDPGNVLTNLRGFGEEIIMQSGKEQPMRMSGNGGLFAGVMQATGTEVNYDFSTLGTETVSTSAGEFEALRINGTGSAETKVVFRKIKVESESTAWMSDQVPFGIVKAEGTSTLNGKPSKHSSELLDFGLSGASSEISGEPRDMPNMGDIFGR